MLYRLLCAFATSACLCVVGYGQNADRFNTNQRILRIRDLGKTDAHAIPILAKDLNDPNRDIRVEAVKAIVKIDTESSLTPLVEATQDNDAEVQIRATDGLVNFYLPGYVVKSGLTGSWMRGVRQVRAFFSSRNNQTIDQTVAIRRDVGEALGRLASGGSSMDARANAALAAGILRAEPAVPGLETALHSKNSEVIFETLVALQKIKDPTAGPSVSFLAHDFDERIQSTALETIGVLHSSTSAPDVRSALRDARSKRVRRAALEALAMLAIPEDHSIFEQYVNDPDPELRASGLEGLGRIRDPKDFPVLEKAYNERDVDLRVHLAAAFAMVNQGKVDTDVFSPLTYVVNNLNTASVHDIAEAYLQELCKWENVRKALPPLIAQANKAEKIGIAQALGQSQSEDAVPLLEKLSSDIDPDVSLAAAKSLKILEARKS